MQNYFDNSTILVLGGSGLLGYHCHANLVNDFRVVTTYHTHPIPYTNSVHLNVQDGMSSLVRILNKYRPKAVINTIALVTVDGCETNSELAYQLNVRFVQNLVEAMKEVGMRDSQLVQISSDSVYGQRTTKENSPWSEDDLVNPLSIYAKTKFEGELQALKHNGPVSILRTAFYGINPFSEKSLLWWIINNAKHGNTINGWENVYFSPVSAHSLVRVIGQMIRRRFSGVLNVGSTDACNKYDFVDAVCEELQLTANINRVTKPVQGEDIIRPEYSVLNSERLANLVSWDVEWRDDLREYLHRCPPFPAKSNL
ncbi:MAG: SDR family oxidoreductase [Desulfobulbaceae bacterium]|nr:SDR family oxidoreductase [Desulfobulbaceae bacterium]